MTDNLLTHVETQLDELIGHCAKLTRENELLRQREETWQRERARLVEKNDVARTRVEAMIMRLKSLAGDS